MCKTCPFDRVGKSRAVYLNMYLRNIWTSKRYKLYNTYSLIISNHIINKAHGPLLNIVSIFLNISVPKSYNSHDDPRTEKRGTLTTTEASCFGKFRCHDDSGCIETWLTCDNVDHCTDRSDETGCGRLSILSSLHN